MRSLEGQNQTAADASEDNSPVCARALAGSLERSAAGARRSAKCQI